MGDQSAGSNMVEISAACVKQWNLDFDRGLRSQKQGAQYEAVMKLGPQLLRWSHDCEVTASSANLFKLEPGQDRVFASAILLRVAETFRSGNNFVRVCVLKALMLEYRGRGWIGEAFSGENFERVLMSKHLIPKSGSHSRALRRFRSGEGGLLTKKRIENHVEILRRVKSVIKTGDPTARALAIRVLGCLADLGKDSADVHKLVLQAVHSPHRQEITAAIFAMGCLSELSEDFAKHCLEKAFALVYAMETTPEVKVLAVRLFAKLGRSSVLALEAFEMGRRIMLRYPIHEIITSMLISLTMITTESSVIVGSQVDLLLTYIAAEPRMNVRAIALKCLVKLAPRALGCIEAKDAKDEIFNGAFAVVQDRDVPSPLHVLAMQVIQKVFQECVATLEFEPLLEIIAWIELTALSEDWQVAAQAFSLLVDMVRHVKLKLPTESPEDRKEMVELSIRICLLLCDRLAVTGAALTRDWRQDSRNEEEILGLIKVKVTTICMLLVKLVQGYPPVGWQVVDCLAGLMDSLAQWELGQRKVSGGNKGSEKILEQESSDKDKNLEQESSDKDRNLEQESSDKDKDGQRHEDKDSASVMLESSKAERSANIVSEVLIKEVGRCMSACVALPEYKAKTVLDIHKSILKPVSVLICTDFLYPCLLPVLQALMKATLAHDCLTLLTTQVDRNQRLENLADSRTAGGRISGLLTQSRSILKKFETKLIEDCSFWMLYEIGKQGALSALWDLAHFAFDSLVDKTMSEGCYFWLSALSHQAKAEALLRIWNCLDKNDDEQDREQTGGSANTAVPMDTDSDKGKGVVKEDESSTSSTMQESLSQCGGFSLERFGKAAAQAVPLFRNSISSLSAGICLEQTFEFQRCVLSLRLDVLECVSELLGVLARISSLDTDAGVIDLEDEQGNNDLKSLKSALRAGAERIQLLASRLMGLTEEYDLLSISFMGIDQKSVGILSSAALFCSLLTFCSIGVLSEECLSSQLGVKPLLKAGAVALDLFGRLQQTESEDWDGLLLFAIQSGAQTMGEKVFGGTLGTGLVETTLMKLTRWAVTSVLGLQQQQTLLGVVRGTRLLEEILQECLYLPWPSPPFFFCTRPRIGLELFLAQVGPSAGETEEVSIFQGHAFALSVCLQIIHAPLESLLYLKRLVCAFTVRSAERTSGLVDDYVVNQPLDSAMVERLIKHSKMSTTPTISPHELSSEVESTVRKTKYQAGGLIFSVSLDSKGQGFASCNLDVSRLPRGEYQLILSCICVDGNSGQFILPLLSSRPTFHII